MGWQGQIAFSFYVFAQHSRNQKVLKRSTYMCVMPYEFEMVVVSSPPTTLPGSSRHKFVRCQLFIFMGKVAIDNECKVAETINFTHMVRKKSIYSSVGLISFQFLCEYIIKLINLKTCAK